MNQDKDSGISPMRMACLQLHEMYLELQHSGFSKREALKLVTAVFLSGMSTDDE